MKTLSILLSVIIYAATIVCVYMGFNKMFVYENSNDSFGTHINAYVGGDAYNYIINSGQATAYFVLAVLCVITATSILIITKLYENKEIRAYNEPLPETTLNNNQ